MMFNVQFYVYFVLFLEVICYYKVVLWQKIVYNTIIYLHEYALMFRLLPLDGVLPQIVK